MPPHVHLAPSFFLIYDVAATSLSFSMHAIERWVIIGCGFTHFGRRTHFSHPRQLKTVPIDSAAVAQGGWSIFIHLALFEGVFTRCVRASDSDRWPFDHQRKQCDRIESSPLCDHHRAQINGRAFRRNCCRSSRYMYIWYN